MNEITYVKSEDGDALYLNGVLYDAAPKLNIYDLLVMLESKGIVDKARQINIQPKPVMLKNFNFPNYFKELKIN